MHCSPGPTTAQINDELRRADMAEATTARQDVRFFSGDGECQAWLYLPTVATVFTRVPIIVMAHGFGGIKEMGLDKYAERFVKRGYACLVFDYRHFGASSGEPRELIDVDRELEDYRSAVAYARTVPEADPDRVVLWGTSFAGGHVTVTAADDPRIAATIAQCPFTDGFAAGKRMPFFTLLRLMGRAVQDWCAARRGKEPVRVEVVGEPGEVAVMTAPDSKPGFDLLIADSGLTNWRSQVPARVMFQVPRYIPGRRAKDVRTPILFCICDGDSVTPSGETDRYAAQAVHGEVRHYRAGHFDIYVGEPFETVIRDQIRFLERNVPVVR
ncbi:alpha/beta hydrolase [Nocardia sp. NPDC050408]|uniref:alpha/beta hydrolase n=1 Tax=Nocardia TaxID=1817 RepID=UPI0037B2B98B